jgi:hypothetical protein
MSERKQERTVSTRTDRRFRNTLLVVIAALCTFGGPYAVYVLGHLLKLSLFVSVFSGFVLFAVGVALIWYLAKKKVIS